MPRLRVIASFYRCPDEVDRGLDCVLAQTMGDYECVIVDDASGDTTPARIEAWLERHRDPRFRFAPNATNKGIAWVRSHHSTGADCAYLAFQEAGDRSTPDRYARSLDRLAAEPGLGMVGCGFRNVVAETGRSYVRLIKDPTLFRYESLMRQNRFGGGEIVYDYPTFQAVGGIITDLPYSEDYYTTLRIARDYAVGSVPVVMYERGISYHGLSFRPDAFALQCRCVLAARDMARDRPESETAYLAARGGLEGWRHDPRLRKLLFRGAARSLSIGDWRGSLKIAQAGLGV